MDDNLFDRLPAFVQVAMLALTIITVPIWGIFAIIATNKKGEHND